MSQALRPIFYGIPNATNSKILPLERLLVETDSPWQHEGLEDKAISTQLGAVVEKLAELKRLTVEKVKTQVLENSLRFYGL